VPLGWDEWKIVLAWSAPIIVIDEVLKAMERAFFMETTKDNQGAVARSKKVD
jgi:Ca2+ transporting ATPase